MILTTQQAVSFLQVSQDILYQLLAKNEIPAFRVKGQWRFIQEDLIEWARAQYTCPAGVPLKQEGTCHTNEVVPGSGGSLSKEYDNLLARKTTRTRQHSKTV
ncbi:MAG: DNA-binding protein [Rhodocyclaceae bacterium]|nr:DNA-binding protein [Rhodocyclaceae bacterium]